MNEDKDYGTFNQKIKQSLDLGLDSLDSDIRQQLAARRKLALNQKAKSNWFSVQYWSEYWMPASALAFCTLVAVFVVINPQHSDNAMGHASNNVENPAAVLEVLYDAEDLDVISDPDFYAWSEEALNADKSPDHKDSADAV